MNLNGNVYLSMVNSVCIQALVGKDGGGRYVYESIGISTRLFASLHKLVNLSTARSEKGKEVGIRKVVGAKKVGDRAVYWRVCLNLIFSGFWRILVG